MYTLKFNDFIDDFFIKLFQKSIDISVYLLYNEAKFIEFSNNGQTCRKAGTQSQMGLRSAGAVTRAG